MSQHNQIVKNRVRYNSMDVMKLLMSICVVAIHTHPLDGLQGCWYYPLYQNFVDCAVPYFFLCSGYLLADKSSRSNINDTVDPYVIRKYLHKIIRMYVIWSVIYFPLAIIGFVHDRNGFFLSILYYLRGFFLIGENYNSWFLWYLLSTIYTLLFILYLLKRKVSLNKIVLLGAVSFVFCQLISLLIGWNDELPVIFKVIRKAIMSTVVHGRLLQGFLYLPLGMLLYRKPVSKWYGSLMLVAGIVAGFCLPGIFSSYTIIITAVGIFSITLSVNLKDRPVYIWFNKLSVHIYVLHMLVWSVFYTFAYGHKTYGKKSFLATCLVCVILSLLWENISRIHRIKENT